MSSLADRRVNIVSVVPFKQHTVSSFVSILLFSVMFSLLYIFFFYQITLNVPSKCKFVSEYPLFLDLLVILARLYSLRIWDCQQHEEGDGVRTRPVTICIRTDTNLHYVLNVAVS